MTIGPGQLETLRARYGDACLALLETSGESICLAINTRRVEVLRLSSYTPELPPRSGRMASYAPNIIAALGTTLSI